MSPDRGGGPGGVVARLASALGERRRAPVAVVVAASALAAWPLSRARFSADLTDLLPADSAAAGAFREFRAAFGQSDQLVVVALEREGGERADPIEGGAGGGGRPDPDASGRTEPSARDLEVRPPAKEWIAALREQLEQRAEVARVEGGPLETLTQFATQVLPSAGFAWLTAEEAARLRETLSPEGLRRAFARSLRLLEQSPGLETSEIVRLDPLFFRELFAESAAQLFGGGGGLEGGGAAGGARLRAGVGGGLTAPGGRDGLALLSIAGRRPAQDLEASRALVAAVDAEIAALGVPRHLRLLKTGGYAIAVEDEARIRGDLEKSTLSSAALVLLLFFLGYRGLAPLFLVSLPLLLGIAWGYGLFIALRGGITMLTAIGAAMLVGLGIDFGVHLYSELQRARDEGLEPGAARRAMLERAAPRIAVAALTSAGCFFAFALTGFRGLSDLGLLAGVGLVGCLAAYLLVFPLLMARHEPKRGRAPLARAADGLAGLVLRSPRAAFTLAAAATLAATALLAARGPPPFVADARLLHPERSPALRALAQLDRLVRRPLVPWVVLARDADPDSLARRFARLEPRLEPLVEAGVLAAFELPTRALPPRAAQEAAFAALSGLEAQATARALREQAEATGFDPDAFAGLERVVRENLARAARREFVTLEELRRLGAGALADTFFRPVEGEVLAAGFLFPHGGLLPGPEQSALVDRIGAALAAEPGLSLTGFPVVAAELTAQVRRDFRGVTWLAAGAVVAIVLLVSRSLSTTALALLPVAFAIVWLLAAMRLLGTTFNVMNVVLLPMLVGLGVDNGVHLVFEARRAGDVERALRGVLLPMLVSAVTTIAGFGSLATVDHPAVASMGELAACGVTLALVATLLVLPPLLRRAPDARRGA